MENLLTVEKIQRGEHLKKLNDLISKMYDDMIENSDLKTPRRKVTAEYSIYQDENDEIRMKVTVKAAFPGPKEKQEVIAAVNIRKNSKKQLVFDFEKDPEIQHGGKLSAL